MRRIRAWNWKKKLLGVSLLALLVGYGLCLPKQLFKDPTSTILLDRNGTLLNAKIATDGQWRFPEIVAVPKKFERCILLYEDEHFNTHPGFNPVSIYRAARANMKA
ncbi:MAG: transglycosylase domain-containing protein, partial [Saprospiraceae bacterium]|nr:transglycosylase domain-containing protein [Saprospiraceae bacterium]